MRRSKAAANLYHEMSAKQQAFKVWAQYRTTRKAKEAKQQRVDAWHKTRRLRSLWFAWTVRIQQWKYVSPFFLRACYEPVLMCVSGTGSS